MEETKVYIGDGVYATFDGYHIWLETQRENGMHRIALEPEALANLVKYAKAVREIREQVGN